jgi:hypothetical protein
MVFSPKLVMLINTNMKVQKSSNLNPFGGLNFVMEELDRQKNWRAFKPRITGHW